MFVYANNTNCFFGVVNNLVKLNNLVKHASNTHIQAKMDSSGSIVKLSRSLNCSSDNDEQQIIKGSSSSVDNSYL